MSTGLGRDMWKRECAYMQSSSELSIAAKFDVDFLVQGKTDEVKRFGDLKDTDVSSVCP